MNAPIMIDEDDGGEYVSNPRLRILAEELKIYGEILEKQNLPDSIRLSRMREFAQASRFITNISHWPELIVGENANATKRYSFIFNQKSYGPFENPTIALQHYKAAHIEHFGLESEFHPDAVIDDSHLYEGNLPRGISITAYGTYEARYRARGVEHRVGTYFCVADAMQALEAHRATYVAGPREEAFMAAKAAKAAKTAERRERAAAKTAERRERAAAKTAEFQARLKVKNQEREEARAARAAERLAKEQARTERNVAKAASTADRVAICSKARSTRTAQAEARRIAALERYGDKPLPIGVRLCGSRFAAQIKTGKGEHKQDRYLGMFDSPQEAGHAYQRALADYRGYGQTLRDLIDELHERTHMTDNNEHKPSLDAVLAHSEGHCEAIRQSAPDCFEPFIKAKHGTYALGTFKTRPEAERAITDALAARSNG